MRSRLFPFSGRLGRRAALLLALVAGFVPGSVSAQVADAVVEVAVVDESAGALPGVTVTIERPETGLSRTGVTDETGTLRVPALPPGTYVVTVELPGFATVKQEGLVLRVGQTARLDITMKVAQLAETVTVVAEQPLVDVYKTDSSTNIVPEQIEALPVQGRDFQNLAFLAPGVQRERGGFRFIGGGPVIGAGGNASQSTILVDGVDFTDPTLGLARARFSQDAISEFRVISNRFDTEIGGSSGGALSIITKSGTNDVKGSVFGFLRDDALRAKGKLELQKNDYSRQQFGFTLGGPIVKDQTHYFASFEQINEDAITLFRPGGSYASLADDVELPLNQSLLYGGLDHRIDDAQSLRLKFMYERYRLDNARVGGVADLSSGTELNRDNWNLTGTHAWTVGKALNQLSVQVGRRKFETPTNSSALAEYFSSGNTLISGANIVGDQLNQGDIFELRDTFFVRLGSGQWAQDVKVGGAWQRVKDRWNFPLYPQALMFYANDTRLIPIVYAYGTGSADTTITTHLISGFAQTEMKPMPRLTINAGVRYDLDTDGNNPDFTSPMMTDARGRDTNNFQPRAGFSWDVLGDGQHVVRGGAGLFTGRFLLVPAHTELQQNGFTGRILQQRISGILLGLPAAFWLSTANPAATGIALPRDATKLDDELVNPYAVQATLGYTLRLGATGLFADFEGIYVKGEDEMVVRDVNYRGNATGGRINPAWNQINAYTNEGRSEYKAFVASLNGTLRGGHVVSASFTVADKKNIGDDFSPALTDYPSDPADIEAEWGRSRADERYRFVASAVMRLPYNFTVAPIFEYGSGQPWNRRLGYDFNGDGKTSDRLPGIGKFSEDGPDFSSVNLRVTYRLRATERVGVDVIAEAFNLFNRKNYDVNSIVNGEYLSGPTLALPGNPYVPNPRYKEYTSTLAPFEAQLGVRVVF